VAAFRLRADPTRILRLRPAVAILALPLLATWELLLLARGVGAAVAMMLPAVRVHVRLWVVRGGPSRPTSRRELPAAAAQQRRAWRCGAQQPGPLTTTTTSTLLSTHSR
jgi:hypothetical protein